MRVSALLTCFNRKAETLDCLQRIFAQNLPKGARLQIVLVDDGSTDGTSEAVLSSFPEVRIIGGDGSLFWCGGMRRAWQEAALDQPDYFLLVNDDTLLEASALENLLALAPTPDHLVIAVGAICDAETAVPTYGGIARKSGNMSAPNGEPAKCDTFNANAVLIPRAVHARQGILHHAYTHGMGDFDYGFQASRRGIKIIQTGGFVGTCSRNSDKGTWRDTSLTRRERWSLIRSPKGLPFREWLVFNYRNIGWSWPVKTISPYIRVLLGL